MAYDKPAAMLVTPDRQRAIPPRQFPSTLTFCREAPMLGFPDKGFRVGLSKGVRMFPFRLATVPRQSRGKKSTAKSACMTARTLTATFVLLAYGTMATAADSTSQVIRDEAPKGITTTFYTCIDNAGSDTVALAACLSAEKTMQDNRLNTTYKALLGKLNDKAKSKLIIAERTWLKLQDENGGFEDSLYGDEIIDNLDLTQDEIFSICERANKLNRYLSIARDR